MANIAHLDVYSGEDRTLSLAGRDSANVAKNLTGLTVAWYVGRSPFRPDNSTPIVTKDGALVSAAAGTFTVDIDPSDTQYLNGDYEHMAVASDNTVIVQGRFRIRPAISP